MTEMCIEQMKINATSTEELKGNAMISLEIVAPKSMKVESIISEVQKRLKSIMEIMMPESHVSFSFEDPNNFSYKKFTLNKKKNLYLIEAAIFKKGE